MEYITQFLTGVGLDIAPQVLIAIGVVLVLGYFLRNQIKVFVSNFAGYRAELDDYSLAVHRNQEVIFENQRAIFKNSTRPIILFSLIVMPFALLVHPVLFGATWLTYRALTLKSVLPKIKAFKLFDTEEFDSFIDKFNTGMDHIDVIIKEIWLSVYVLLSVAFFTHSMTLALTGLTLATLTLVTTFVVIANVFAYRTNYKHVEYYRALRIVNESMLTNVKPTFFFIVFAFLSFTTQDMESYRVYSIILTLLSISVRIALKMMLRAENGLSAHAEKVDSREYTDIHQLASYANYKDVSRGLKWATPAQVEMANMKIKAKSDKVVELSNYDFYPEIINRSDLRKNPDVLKSMRDITLNIDALDTTKQMFLIGAQGSAKTTAMNNIIKQVHDSDFILYRNILMFDKAGDFTKRFYREEKDIIVNLYDDRSQVFCFFSEMKHNIEAGNDFIKVLFNTIVAENNDEFFSQKAKQLAAGWTKECYFQHEGDTKAMWSEFFELMSSYKKEVEEKDNRTDASVVSVLEIVVEILSIMKYQIVDENRKVFSIHDYLHSENVQLFLSGNEKYATKLQPYINGVLSAMSSGIQALPEQAEEFQLFVIDEFLSILPSFEKQTRINFLTNHRKKGCANIWGGQYWPKDDEYFQDISSSLYALFVFSISDPFTQEKVIEKIGKNEFLSRSYSPQSSKNGGNKVDTSGNGQSAAASGGMQFLTPLITDAIGDAADMMNEVGTTFSIDEKDIIYPSQLEAVPTGMHLAYFPKIELNHFDKADSKRYFKLFAFGFKNLLKKFALGDDFIQKQYGLLCVGRTKICDFSLNNPEFVEWDSSNFYRSQIKNKKSDATTTSSLSKMSNEEKFEIYYQTRFISEELEKEHGSVSSFLKSKSLSNADITAIYNQFENSYDGDLSEDELYEISIRLFNFDKNDSKSRFDLLKKHNLLNSTLAVLEFSNEHYQELGIKEANDEA